MLKFLSGLSFLYGLAILVLIIYGLFFYRQFSRSSRQQKLFPYVFGLISIACLTFLWVNFHASLNLKTFSNLDHHFLRHDGYSVLRSIELGNSDTVNFPQSSYNSFRFAKESGKVVVTSAYSEEPFYIRDGEKYKIASKTFSADNNTINFTIRDIAGSIAVSDEDRISMNIGGEKFEIELKIKKGISIWNAFRIEESFLNSQASRLSELSEILGGIYLVRDDVSRKSAGELRYFISGNVLHRVSNLTVNQEPITNTSIQFKTAIDDESGVAWGIGFLDNNRNQYRITNSGGDSFFVSARYPVSYPLIEENRKEWKKSIVNKFLVSSPSDITSMPAVFSEGFMFEGSKYDHRLNFKPVLLSYEKNHGAKPLNIHARLLENTAVAIPVVGDKLSIPSSGGDFVWSFTINNTYDWHFSSMDLSASAWQFVLFGSLLFFILLIMVTAIIRPPEKTSWIWQILACVSMVLLTTRYFFFWRYKTFPPFEGMDLPSLQQLNSIWNFGIIVTATIVLALIFGFPAIQPLWNFVRVKLKIKRSQLPSFDEQRLEHKLTQLPLIKRFGARNVFFIGWVTILIGGLFAAFISGFDPGICRHLAIGLIVAYFLFSLISYKHSPLVVSDERAWWKVNTSKVSHVIFSNPVRVLLTLSLLGVFLFIDIGFAIVFLNFILFNETFLAINYSISGLSSGNRRNATVFGILGFIYLFAFVANLVYAPYIFSFLLNLPSIGYLILYVISALYVTITAMRLFPNISVKRRRIISMSVLTGVFLFALFFFPKERILSKAAMTKYRIDVMTMPVEEAIESAYAEGKTWQPVIRAAQNQWFINTFIDEENNPGSGGVGFNLIQHAPQTKGAKYNAQATDLVASRFFLAEHGTLAVLLYVLLLLLPLTMLASFYKLYPDFSNRVNPTYPLITAGFSILNYLLITALLVILAATGRYIFFGQDLPFGSILSKQSILFPAILIILSVLIFRKIPLEYYANRKKLIPGAAIFLLVAGMLFFLRPGFNRNKEFNVPELASSLETYVQLNLQPILDHFDTSRQTKRLSIAEKDRRFTDSLRKMLRAGILESDNGFFMKEISSYSLADFNRHLNQNRMLYLDLYTGRPKLAVNENYFRVDAPPHLQDSWKGNVFGDSSNYNISIWNGTLATTRVSMLTNEPDIRLNEELTFSLRKKIAENRFSSAYLVNKSDHTLTVATASGENKLRAGDSLRVSNPWKAVVTSEAGPVTKISITPDAFMNNYYVNGSRFYVYPLASRFVWARNFAESVSIDFTKNGSINANAFVSIDFELMDSLTTSIQSMMAGDTSYGDGAEYAVAVADGNGRLVAIADHIKGLKRPDPNDKAGFNTVILGDNGFVSQSLLRKQIGNINLLRMNPGPGSTLKPILFSAIASQLPVEWEQFSSEGFTGEQEYFGGEKVKGYDFELNNGRISSISDFIRTSDNYYYSNVLLFGSYPKQSFIKLLDEKFQRTNPGSGIHWPNFSYAGKSYWLDDYKNWPGYLNGKSNFGLDSSFTSIGLRNNYGIDVKNSGKGYQMFETEYDSSILKNSAARSGFILPESSIFDQYGDHVDKRIPYDVFANCFRGHVKGSSQVLIPPVKMLESIGKLFSQNRNFSLTLNPYASTPEFRPFDVDAGISYNNYLGYLKSGIFTGMLQVLNNGTATRLGSLLKNGSGYYYYAKTGTTGDNESKTKSKLLTLTISLKDVSDPGFNFRDNKFYTIYFTLQNGPAKQNEEYIAKVVRMIENSVAFNAYMK